MAEVKDKTTPLFVVAIGGTGMRCLESFVHLCAIGMFDNRSINILTLDTDSGNGNKERAEQLVENYIAIKRGNGKEYGQPNINTFFSAQIRMYKYATDYSGDTRNSYRSLQATTGLSQEDKEQNEDLADLFLDRDTVQEFNLSHGYRAQTHLGSMLMYHSILESARNRSEGKNTKNKDQDEALCAFLEELNGANNPRVFIFGSIFGGTGASSIPIIPVAFRDAIRLMAQIKEGSASMDFNEVRFGASLLTDYFTFKGPNKEQKQKGDEVIADSGNFALNCQAALDFYSKDPTVKQVYKRLYNIGWPLNATKYGNEKDDKVQTGGNTQRNDCHVVELMCACAAYDFFTLEDADLKELKFVYRSPQYEQNYCFTGKDFMGAQKGDVFTNKLGAFLSFSHLALSHFKGAVAGSATGSGSTNGVKEFLQFFKDNNIEGYEPNQEWNDSEMDLINKYLRLFAYEYANTSSEFQKGWLFQVYDSVGQSQFLFKSTAFQQDIIKNSTVDEGDIFLDEQHNWCEKSWLPGKGKSHTDSYNKLGKCMKEERAKNFEGQSVSSTKEKFLAHIYNGITIAQKYNTNKR